MTRSSQPNAALQLVTDAPEAERAPAQMRPKHLRLDVAQATARISEVARVASGCTQTELALHMRTSRQVVTGFESGDRTCSLKHLLTAPDSYVDAALAELALLRAAAGFAARQWVAAPELVHDCEHARTASLVLELTDVLRARTQGADRETLRREVGEAIEALQELVAAMEAQ